MNNMFKNIAIWLVVALVLMTVFNQFSTHQAAQSQVDYSQFLDEVKQGQVAKVTIENHVLKGVKTDGKAFTSYAPSDPWMVSDLLKNGVVVQAVLAREFAEARQGLCHHGELVVVVAGNAMASHHLPQLAHGVLKRAQMGRSFLLQ